MLAIWGLVSGLGLLALWLRLRLWRRGGASSSTRVGFLHPSCAEGGGGERVLWRAVSALIAERGEIVEVIVFGGSGEADDVKRKVQNQFGFDIDHRVRIVQLRTGFWTKPSYFPAFTLLLQSLTGIIVTLEALLTIPVDVLIETSAHPFAPFAAWLLDVRILSYIHYPTISSEMLRTVSEGRKGVNNSSFVTSSRTATKMKIFYYRLFARIYSLAGRLTDVVLANSSWTGLHLREIFGNRRVVHVVYPPCEVGVIEAGVAEHRNEGQIISLAQFRPEKNHEKQLEMMNILVNEKHCRVRLKLIGGARNHADEDRAAMLQQLSAQLKLKDNCEFHVNVPYQEVRRYLAETDIAVHTMSDEHFGISVVEMMASGAIIIGHNSGGVRDIIENGTSGFLAESSSDYATVVERVIAMRAEEKARIREGARKRALMFSDDVFDAAFVKHLIPLL
ncbi:hypothetical protein NDN08_000780 [Rhodosorus marinus]|uniref:GDP-Man:Man(3)GlcNAc(2)-PP-Dol alpha-1,2-mannosyltransferase n=1 Tax=Rhodosorus marinus TaxID=101924 RepID=A0AAV8UUM2_9RHOD|nr:hypothetical protein NDN08_000780 [Rhodosorus marinus]